MQTTYESSERLESDPSAEDRKPLTCGRRKSFDMELWRILDPSVGSEGTAADRQGSGTSHFTSLLDTVNVNVTPPRSNSHRLLPVPAPHNERLAHASHQADDLRHDIASSRAPPLRSSAISTHFTHLTAPVIRTVDQLVILKIEDQLRAISEALHRKEEMSILIKTKRPVTCSSQDSPEARVAETWVKFPGRTEQEARRFAVLVRILDLMHEALTNNVVVSKRNIYYKDPPLFKKQAVVDRYVDILAFTFGVHRADLNVTAAAKGLVIGGFNILRKDGTIVRVNRQSGTSLIGDLHDYQAIECLDTKWILVVEKESTFRTLAFTSFHRISRAGRGIILTAKGYPDISSRAFLRLLTAPSVAGALVPPIFALVDFDPDGIAIMSTFKHGSWNMSHENTRLNVPGIRWLGLRSRDLLKSSPACEGTPEKEPLLLTSRDRRMATKMLERPVLKELGEDSEWRRELQVMLVMGFKAEMEMLDESEIGVAKWIENRLLEKLHLD